MEQRHLSRVTPPTYKIVILGDTYVGKSSLFLRYLRDDFKEGMASTIAIANDFKEIIVDGNPVHLQIWDTAGQEKFKSIVSQLYRDVDGFILVYDVNVPRSFSEMKLLVSELKPLLNPNFTILIGNKIDICNDNDLIEQTTLLKQFSNEHKFKYFLTSAKTGHQVNDVFEVLGKSLFLKKEGKPKPNNALKSIKKWRRRFCL